LAVNALQYVFSLEQFGVKLGLDHIRSLCSALGNPQRAYHTIIVAGTNGKGSVTAMVDRALGAAGHRSARYISPHLFRLEERFAVNGREITHEALEATAEKVVRAIHDLLARGVLAAPPTFFEATTAIAFEAFRDARAEIAVLEVGLGGRLDATNIAEPLVVAITSIDRDHEQQLGHTLREIAFEKAGVIKPGRPAIIGPLAGEARAEILRVAGERGAPAVEALDGVTFDASGGGAQLTLTLRTPVREYPPIPLALAGRHQVTNAIVSVRVLEALESQGVPVGEAAVVEGLSTVRWPGRLEWIDVADGSLLLDAAHNPAGAASLADYLRELPSELPLVFGAVKGKDVRGMLEVLLPRVSRVIATEAPTPRAQRSEEIARQIRAVHPSMNVAIEPDPIAASRSALRDCRKAIVAGSIFLIGEVRGRLAAGLHQ
jgi:dihydrofolate synthase/folylpolyglutamate synthase